MMALIREDLGSARRAPRSCSSRSALWSKPGAIEECLTALDQRGLIYTGVLEPPKGKTARTIGSRGRRLCSAPPNSATMSTGR